MRNIVYDFFMSLICVLLVLTLFGIFILPDVLETWVEGRK